MNYIILSAKTLKELAEMVNEKSMYVAQGGPFITRHFLRETFHQAMVKIQYQPEKQSDTANRPYKAKNW